MSQVTIGATIAVEDTQITPDPNPIPMPGAAINCPNGLFEQVVVLPAATLNQVLNFPLGLATAAVLVVYAQGAADLVVKTGGASLPVPFNQPLFLYNVAAGAVTVSSALGGKISTVVGG